MKTALDQLKIDIARDCSLKDNLLNAIKNKTPTMNTNVSSITIDYNENSVTIVDDLLVTSEPIIKIGLDNFIEEIKSTKPSTITVTSECGQRKKIDLRHKQK